MPSAPLTCSTQSASAIIFSEWRIVQVKERTSCCFNLLNCVCCPGWMDKIYLDLEPQSRLWQKNICVLQITMWRHVDSMKTPHFEGHVIFRARVQKKRARKSRGPFTLPISKDVASKLSSHEVMFFLIWCYCSHKKATPIPRARSSVRDAPSVTQA